MGSRAMVEATLQAAILGALSNVLAQVIEAGKNKGTESDIAVDWIPVLQYLLFSAVSAPPNFVWQVYLESAYPAHPPPPRGGPQRKSFKDGPPLSLCNMLIKFALDQTVGAAVNTLLFIIFTNGLRAAMVPAPRFTSLPAAALYWTQPGAIEFRRVRWQPLFAAAYADFWPIAKAGLKVWLVVSLLNYTIFKSAAARNLFGALAGVLWGVYINLAAAH